MRQIYFKHRKLFDFENEFDIGQPILWAGQKEDNHFLYRLEKLPVERWPDFYHYHLSFFIRLYDNSTEHEFFKHVCRILNNGIDGLKRKDRFDSRHDEYFKRQLLYEEFLELVLSTDPEGMNKAKDEIIASQKLEILSLQKMIAELEDKIRNARKNQTNDFINILPGHLLTLVDIIYQLQDLCIDNKELVFSLTQIIWPKLLNEYFREGNEEIKLETIRRYFPADRSRSVPVKNRLFKLSLIKDTSKEKQSRTSTKVSRS